MHILIVDDQRTICVAMAELVSRELARLQSGPLTVKPLFRLAEAADYLDRNRDVVLTILDLDLGAECKGLDTLRRFKAIADRFLKGGATLAITARSAPVENSAVHFIQADVSTPFDELILRVFRRGGFLR